MFNLDRLRQRAYESVNSIMNINIEQTEALTGEFKEAEEKIFEIQAIYEKVIACATELNKSRNGWDEQRRIEQGPMSVLGEAMVNGGETLGKQTGLGNALFLAGKSQLEIGKSFATMECKLEDKLIEYPNSFLTTELFPLSAKRADLENDRLELDSRKRNVSSLEQLPPEQKTRREREITQAQEAMGSAQNAFLMSRNRLGVSYFDFLSREPELVANLLELVNCELSCFRDLVKKLERTNEELSNIIETTKVFGRDIQDYTSEREVTIPRFLEQSIAFLDEAVDVEGIFRISGSTPVVKKLKHLFNLESPDINLKSDEYKDQHHAVASLVKLYFRELPNPLIPYSLYQDFVESSDLEHEEKLKKIKTLLTVLPRPNYDTIKFLARFLCKVASHSEINRMDSSNISIVFGPTIFRCDDSKLSESEVLNQSWNDNGKLVTITCDMITYYSWFFDDESDVEKLKLHYYKPDEANEDFPLLCRVLTDLTLKSKLKKSNTTKRQPLSRSGSLQNSRNGSRRTSAMYKGGLETTGELELL